MSAVTPADVRAAMAEAIAEQLAARGMGEEDLADDLDLLGAEIVDSFGLLELITAIEERFGIELDFETVEVADMTAVGPFCRHVAETANAAAGVSS